MPEWSIDLDRLALDTLQRANRLVVATLLDITNEIVTLDIFDLGTWRSSWYARKGDIRTPIPVTDGAGAGRSSSSEITLELRGHSLGDTYTFIQGTSYGAALEFKVGNKHEGKVRGVLSRASSIAIATATRLR